MPFPRKYSDAQRAAIVHEMVTRGTTAKGCAAKAAAGELEHGGRCLDAFEVPWRYCRDLASAAKREAQLLEVAQAGAPGALDHAGGRIMALLLGEISKAERAKKAGKLTPERVTALAKAHTACRQALIGGGGKAVKNGKAPASSPDGGDFLGEIAQQQER